ncbi:hypothetical protein Y032_0642g1039 [Ancylostoma ceylanicum]|uniref:Uncharacterized protein n=1 Tax=Ancylostoma ceylanicum TaxID=53326 RepID=A0A016WKD6_9BILA|nr:hypothetical protein Y032_0642g1039 [Ancylostoma ceylanicum]
MVGFFYRTIGRLQKKGNQYRHVTKFNEPRLVAKKLTTILEIRLFLVNLFLMGEESDFTLVPHTTGTYAQ